MSFTFGHTHLIIVGTKSPPLPSGPVPPRAILIYSGPLVHIPLRPFFLPSHPLSPIRPLNQPSFPLPSPTKPVWWSTLRYASSQPVNFTSSIRIPHVLETPFLHHAGGHHVRFGQQGAASTHHHPPPWGHWPLNSTGRHGYFLKSTCDIKPIDLATWHGAFLKFDMWHETIFKMTWNLERLLTADTAISEIRHAILWTPVRGHLLGLSTFGGHTEAPMTRLLQSHGQTLLRRRRYSHLA